MGLNWGEALNRVSAGLGQIAQVKYSEFVRNDENKQRTLREEAAYQKQMNLARFQQEFTREQNELNRGLDREQMLAREKEFGMSHQLDIERTNIARSQASAANADRAAGAGLRDLQVKQATLALEQATQTAEFQKEMSPYLGQLASIEKQREQYSTIYTAIAKQSGDTTAIEAKLAALDQQAKPLMTKIQDWQFARATPPEDVLTKIQELTASGMPEPDARRAAWLGVVQPLPGTPDPSVVQPPGKSDGGPGILDTAMDMGAGMVSSVVDPTVKGFGSLADRFSGAREEPAPTQVADRPEKTRPEISVAVGSLSRGTREQLARAFRLNPDRIGKDSLSESAWREIGGTTYNPMDFKSIIMRGYGG